VLAAQISWSEELEAVLGQAGSLEKSLQNVESMLNLLADSVLQEQPPLRRKKLEHLVRFLFWNFDVSKMNLPFLT